MLVPTAIPEAGGRTRAVSMSPPHPIPHPIPYQGSKRRLAPRILDTVAGRRIDRLFEPFAGSAALTLAASNARVASRYVIADSLGPLVELWRGIIDDPERVAVDYERIWAAQHDDSRRHFLEVRDEFNESGDPPSLLYLLARCVKNSPRFNRHGRFNQSADHRRTGMNPRKMRREIEGACRLLRGATTTACGDFEAMLADARPCDLAYLDPPWEGTSTGVDRRYHESLPRERLIAALDDLNRRGVPGLLSYDGSHGDKTYGAPLPDELEALRIELHAGRSSQATLNGRSAMTVESLYVSRQLASPAASAQPARLFDLAA
jgi:DNA adenine methylase